jgi:hypothetical protein
MHGLRSRVEILSLVLPLLAPLARVCGQQTLRRSLPPLELRIDAIDVRSTESGMLQGGVGVNIPLGYYARLEIDGAGGATKRDSVNHASGRVDALARFLLDPFAETAWGLSIGGGISALFGGGVRTHEYLVVVADLEVPRVGAIVPALQVGLGGGARIGVVARIYQVGRR